MSIWPSDQDLEDFAWERLDDPRAEQAIRERMASDPEVKARIEELRALKEALHAHYDRALDWPVPDRVERMTRAAPAWRFPSPLQAAFGAGLFALGVVSGAWLDPEEAAWRSPHLEAFEQRALLSSGAFTSLVSLDSLSVEDEVPSLAGVVRRLQRLTEVEQFKGLRVEGAQTVHLGHIQGVRVLLHGANGERASLFVQPRWALYDGKVDIVSRDDVSLATWVDGPFSYGLAAEGDRQALGGLAESLRTVLGPPSPRQSRQEPLMVQGLPNDPNPITTAPPVETAQEVLR